MSLTKLDIYNVRNIVEATLIPSPTINFIYGNNASGKSSLLEAIYILGRLKSFRSNNLKKVICFDAEEFVIRGQVFQQLDDPIAMGVQLNNKHLQTRFKQQTIKNRSTFAYTLPLQLIHPKSYKLLDAGPQLRREFIDWGIFNTDPGYLKNWRNYKKALGQRNYVLKHHLIEQIGVWDNELVKYGTILSDYRNDYLAKLKPIFLSVVNQFLSVVNLDISYSLGWITPNDFGNALQNTIEKDLKYGYTTCGPHHGDFKLLVNGKLAKDYVSRGELKLLVLALKLAQIQLLKQNKESVGCILIDDLASELDKQNKSKLLNFLADMGMQVFITATDKDEFVDFKYFPLSKMFHVEHGCINQI